MRKRNEPGLPAIITARTNSLDEAPQVVVTETDDGTLIVKGSGHVRITTNNGATEIINGDLSTFPAGEVRILSEKAAEERMKQINRSRRLRLHSRRLLLTKDTQ